MSDYLKRTAAQSQIVQLENRIEELRLEHIPDLEAIGNLREAVEKIRKEFMEDTDRPPIYLPL